MATHSFEDVLRHYFRALVRINQVQRPLTIRMLMGWRESGGPFDVDPPPGRGVPGHHHQSGRPWRAPGVYTQLLDLTFEGLLKRPA